MKLLLRSKKVEMKRYIEFLFCNQGCMVVPKSMRIKTGEILTMSNIIRINVSGRFMKYEFLNEVAISICSVVKCRHRQSLLLPVLQVVVLSFLFNLGIGMTGMTGKKSQIQAIATDMSLALSNRYVQIFCTFARNLQSFQEKSRNQI